MNLSNLKRTIQLEGVQSLSQKTGLSRSTIHDFASLGKGLSLRNLEKICQALGYKISLDMTGTLSTRDVLGTLLLNQRLLRAAGIRHLSLFGSVAKGTQRPDSDIDLLVTAEKMEGLRTISGIQKSLEALLPAARLDIVFASSLKPPMKKAIKEDAIHVF